LKASLNKTLVSLQKVVYVFKHAIGGIQFLVSFSCVWELWSVGAAFGRSV